MPESRAPGEGLTDLLLTLFRANNAALVWGDRMVQRFDLTSARWQVLGTIAYADRPQPVSWLARDLGANRQNVQRIVNDLVREDILRLEPNPHHKRAQLVRMTRKGRAAYERALEVYRPAAASLADGIEAGEIETAARVLATLRRRLERINAGTDDARGDADA